MLKDLFVTISKEGLDADRMSHLLLVKHQLENISGENIVQFHIAAEIRKYVQ